MAWPPTGLSLHWFGEALANPAIPRALLNSILAALGAAAIALVLGTLAALAVQRFAFFGRDSISFLLVLPIALPGVVTGIALSTTFRTLGVDFGLPTIIIGHATFCVVIAYNNVVARLRRLPRTPEEASADLGADTWITFRRITLPGMRTRAAVRRAAGVRAVVRRDHRHALHRRRRDADDPHLDARRHAAPDRAAGRQRGGHRAGAGLGGPGLLRPAHRRRGGGHHPLTDAPPPRRSRVLAWDGDGGVRTSPA